MSRPRCFASITKESCFLNQGNPLDFVLTKWFDNNLVYLVWSTFCSVYTIALVIYTSVITEYGLKILIWLTYWAFYSVTLRFLITASNCWLYVWHQQLVHLPKRNSPNRINVVQNGKLAESNNGTSHADACSEEQQPIPCKPDAQDDTTTAVCLNDKEQHEQLDSRSGHLPVMMRFQWFLQNVSNAVSVLVTLLFWTLVYTGEAQSYASINSHVINSLLVIGDIMISRAPIRIQHFHIPLIYLTFYIIFTLIYWAAGGTNHKGEYFIYGVLDYSNHPKTAALAICLIALLGVLLTQIFLYFVYRLRNCLHSWKKSGKFQFQEE